MIRAAGAGGRRKRGRPAGTLHFDDSRLLWLMARMVVRSRPRPGNGAYWASQLAVSMIPELRDGATPIANAHRSQTVERLRKRWSRDGKLRNNLLILAKRELDAEAQAQRRWLLRLGGHRTSRAYLASDPPSTSNPFRTEPPRMVQRAPLPPDDRPTLSLSEVLEALGWVTAPRDPKIGGR